MPDLSPNDPNSYARPDQGVVREFHLDWQVDFARQVVIGSVLLTVECVEDAQELILDTRDLVIKSVKDVGTGQAVSYALGEAHPNFGTPLTLTIPSTPRDNTGDFSHIWKVEVEYETSPSCSALQWLSPEQTAGKRHPYVFSQCQPIHCRSLLPCQDTPAVKAKYSATVRAPQGLTALMSALRDGQEEEGCNTYTTFKFRQPVPIPSYLVALAVGDLESRDVGPRTRCWSEKELVDQCAYEFAETETMIQAAEELCGPYVWGQYDLLILPPSFPYGGMENPCLTFVTPTLLAGDRSLADVVIHEISHSWTGNLITNNQWEHFWLNEGFTMFVQRKVEGRLKGDAVRHFSALGGWKDLADTINTRGANDPLTRLVPDLRGVDPDDAFSTVPYEKGHTLLWHLEELLGGPAQFEPFLKSYLDKFKFRSLNSDQFVQYLKEYFKGKEEVLAKVDWEAWWTTPGMPLVKPKFNEALAVPCSELARRWVEWDPVTTPSPFTKTDLDALSPSQVSVWLAQLLEEEKRAPLSAEKVCMMEEIYGMSKKLNSEIRFRWLRLGIKARWEEAVEPALKFVTEQGRMKFVRPIYRDLYDWEAMRERAIATFKRNKPTMMHVAAYVVAKDLHLKDCS